MIWDACTEAMLTMAPPPFFRRCGRVCLQQYQTPSRSTEKHRRHGVVDQDVEGADGVRGLGDHGCHRVFVGHVGLNEPRAGQRGGHRRSGLPIAFGDDDARTFRGELACDSLSDSLTCACYDGNLAAQSRQRHFSYCVVVARSRLPAANLPR